MNLRPLLPLCVLVSAAALSAPANATTYCVNNVSSLAAAFTSANGDPEGSTHDIRVRSGTYVVSAGLSFDPAGDKDGKDFSITGGWNSDCSARTINPAATIFNGENGATDADFRFYGNNARYVIEGIRFINFREVIVDDADCGFDCPDTSAIRVRYNEFRNGIDTLIRAKDAAQLTVTNNLFANLTPQFGQAVGIIYANTELVPVIAFNTIAGVVCPTGSNVPLYIYNLRSGATLHHNLVQHVGCGAGITISSGSQPMALRNNLYPSLGGVPPSAQSGNVVSASPLFVNSGAGDFHLQESGTLSPAINAGMTPIDAQVLGLYANVPSQDLDGPAGARLIGTRYDIGAYESSINNSSVLTVVNENDSGAGSLRAAITSANASPGLQRIEFNIAGSCVPTPHLILLSSPLPDITDSLDIDGYSEPEAAANTLTNGSDAVLCVMIGAASGTLAQALQVPVGAAAGTSLSVKGIAFLGSTGFNGNFTVALRLRGGSDHVIQGNAFAGTGPGSVGSLGTLNFGLQIRDTAQNVLVGGADPEHRNSFGAMNSSAIVLNDATSGGHTIQNNYIGLSANGQTASPIGLNGIFASASPNIQILDNVISAVSTSAAISITGATATGYLVQRNRLGVNAFGIPTAAFRNGTGISIAGGAGDNQIGALGGSTASNLITNSDDAGVWITTTAGTGNVVRPNQIYANGQSGVGMGIDIGPLGQSTNDPQDPDTGPNNGQNFPTVVNSLPNPDGTRAVTVSLDSKPNTNFRIDIYRSPDCPAGNRGGNMVTRIGGYAAVTNAAGQMTTTVTANGGGSPGILVAIATNQATGDTSEPSLCFIEPAATVTQISDSFPNPSQIGQAYPVTVTVTNPANGAGVSGPVAIDDGLGNQCTTTAQAGLASCQLLSTSVGNKTLTANFLGTVTHAPSSSTAAHSVVPAITTTTIVSDLPDPSEVGQPYTVNVQVRTQAGNTATPGGQVAVSDGSGQTCQIVSLAAGNGSCQLTSVSVGNKTLTASYAGAINFVASSDTETHTVVAATTVTTITSDAPDPSLPGQTYVVAATVTSAAGTPTGTVAVSDGAGANCQITLAGGGGSCQLASAALGAKTLTATYTPNSQAYAASSDTEGHQVALAATTTTITSDAPDASNVGQAYLVQVSVTGPGGTPTGIVSINDGTGASCDATLSNGVALCQLVSTSGGTKTLTANYPGNASFAASSDTETHTVSAIATTTTISSDTPDPSTAGSAYTVAVTVAAGFGTPGGVVNVDDGAGGNCQITLNAGAGACQLISASAGNKTLTASYVGNASYLASSDTEAHTVNPVAPAATTTLITADLPEPTVVGQPYTVSVSVTSAAGTVAGTVNVNDGAGAGSAQCQIVLENGSGSCQLASNFAGGRLLTACLQANASFAGSCGNESHSTNKADTSIDIGGVNPNTVNIGQSTTVNATLSVVAPGAGVPTGVITVSASAAEQCTITLPATSCPLTLTTAGNRTITLNYAGDANFNPSVRTTSAVVQPDQLLKNGFE